MKCVSLRFLKSISSKVASLGAGAWCLTSRLLYGNGRDGDRVDRLKVSDYDVMHIR
jgi:hypothetical protein